MNAIIPKWMEYILLFEEMLNIVIYARDHYLISDGIILPSRCTISIVGSDDAGIYYSLNFYCNLKYIST